MGGQKCVVSYSSFREEGRLALWEDLRPVGMLEEKLVEALAENLGRTRQLKDEEAAKLEIKRSYHAIRYQAERLLGFDLPDILPDAQEVQWCQETLQALENGAALEEIKHEFHSWWSLEGVWKYCQQCLRAYRHSEQVSEALALARAAASLDKEDEWKFMRRYEHLIKEAKWLMKELREVQSWRLASLPGTLVY